MMVASVLAFHLDNGRQRAGLPTSTMMVASVLALPSQQWQPACWLTHFNYDGSQRAGFPSGQWQCEVRQCVGLCVCVSMSVCV